MSDEVDSRSRSASSNRRKEGLTTGSNVCREMRNVKSTTYTKTNFEQIAIAIGTAIKPVEDLGAKFEAAALWFRLDRRRPKRPAPSKQREKLTQVAKAARRLLKSLGIEDLGEMADGPGDPEIFKALVLTDLPLNFHPVATRASAVDTLLCAV